jgi:hypothetical protein
MRDFYLSLRPTREVLGLADDLTRDFAPRVAVDNPGHAEITAASDAPITIGVHCRRACFRTPAKPIRRSPNGTRSPARKPRSPT